MSGGDRFAEAADEHRRAVEACAEAIRAVPDAVWDTERGARKWSPAQIAEHLAISYEPLMSELDGRPGMKVVVPWWKRRMLRWKFLPKILEGTFPPGVPAPREIRPAATSRTPEEAARRLAARAESFLERFTQAHEKGRARVTHPYLGRLEGVVAVRFLTAHVRHHLRQLPPAGGGGAGTAISSRHDPKTQRE